MRRRSGEADARSHSGSVASRYEVGEETGAPLSVIGSSGLPSKRVRLEPSRVRRRKSSWSGALRARADRSASDFSDLACHTRHLRSQPIHAFSWGPNSGNAEGHTREVVA